MLKNIYHILLRLIFKKLNRLFSIFLLVLLFSSAFAQDKNIQGIVFDKQSQQRINRVYIYNLRTGDGFYNNTKAEFRAHVREGDVLVSALQGYAVDTIVIGKENTVLIYLQRNTIQLQEVVVRDSVDTPSEQLKKTKEEYNIAYRKGTVGNMITSGGSSGGGGAGLSIDALYSLLSREGRNARQLQKIIERDYRDAMIDYRFTNSLIADVTGLSGEKLTDFRRQYRPGYYFILEANDYDLIQFIKRSYQAYLQNPAAMRLPPLRTN